MEEKIPNIEENAAVEQSNSNFCRESCYFYAAKYGGSIYGFGKIFFT
jgi:hypothetical protein